MTTETTIDRDDFLARPSLPFGAQNILDRMDTEGFTEAEYDEAEQFARDLYRERGE